MNIKSILKNKIFSNASWLILGKIFQMLLNLIVGILTARYLGPSNYGLINYANSYIAFFASICNLGINSIIVKEFIDNRNENGEILGTSIVLKIISSFLSAITIICLAYALNDNDMTITLIVMLCCVGMLFQVFETLNYWFQSKLNSKVTAIATLISYFITSLYKIFLLITQKPILYFAFSTSIDYICLAILLFIFYFANHGQRLSFSIQTAKRILSQSWHFIVPGLMVAVYSQTDKIMLKHIIGATETGYYSTAVSLCNIWCFILIAIIDSMSPVIMKLFNDDYEKYKKMNRLLYSIVFYISIIVSLIFLVFGDFIVNILYGKEYLPAVIPLKILTWYSAFSYLGVARNIWIVCEKKQKYLLLVYIVSAFLNIILNIILIPILHASGAAIASLLAQMLTTIIVPFFIKDIKNNSILMIEGILLRNIK